MSIVLTGGGSIVATIKLSSNRGAVVNTVPWRSTIADDP